jgi:hypothetical protein
MRDKDDEGLVKEFGIDNVKGMGQGVLQGSTNLQEEKYKTECDPNILIGDVYISLIDGLRPPLGKDKYPNDIGYVGHARYVPSHTKRDDKIHVIDGSNSFGKVVISPSIYISSDNGLWGLITSGSRKPVPTKKPHGKPLKLIQKPKPKELVGDPLVNLTYDHDPMDQWRSRDTRESTYYSSNLQS